MPHTVHEKQKLLARIQRIQGQTEAVKRLLEEDEHDCTRILQTIAAARGAMNGLMAEVLEEFIREHVVDPLRKQSGKQSEATEELVDVLRSYLR